MSVEKRNDIVVEQTPFSQPPIKKQRRDVKQSVQPTSNMELIPKTDVRPLFNLDGKSCIKCNGVCCPKLKCCVENDTLQFCTKCSKHHDFECKYWDDKNDGHNFCGGLCQVCHKCYDMVHVCQRENPFEGEFSSDGYISATESSDGSTDSEDIASEEVDSSEQEIEDEDENVDEEENEDDEEMEESEASEQRTDDEDDDDGEAIDIDR